MLKYFYTALLTLVLSLPLNTQAESLAQLQTRAAQGDAQAQFELGDHYFLSDGGKESDQQAVMWFKKAAEQNFAEAQYALGQLSRDGIGVPQDYSQALYWLQQAAEQNHAKAQFDLAYLYLKVKQDYALAAQWLQKPPNKI
ncbi:tetratricopeptide repeat protein [Testudinibacter aquarius]|uniref:Sel1 repeat family protein n=1 Tax=Testudinibacter aquarius TaxID=1524974 RepID=A0A4R3Y548_9PAST|nr:tetratricopeptide repeat protein [Testudinibacter aquarius]KAE9525377.1 hypothetical protein A1D24_04875 [Testudinibacter aquarius]TCV85263.1 Sel1 repeat-containing protein [Testudinibacter aquarius]TNG92122.1 sel1 repeat family protein [Testudinibacter aquarius]